MSTPVPSTRIYGKQLSLTINETEYSADIVEYSLDYEDADSDNLTFAEAAKGGGDIGKLKITAIQSTATASFWRWVWANAGKADVPFKIAPWGNETASAEQPHLTGTLTIGKRPKLGGAADPKKSFVFDVEWDAKVATDLVTA